MTNVLEFLQFDIFGKRGFWYIYENYQDLLTKKFEQILYIYMA